MWIDTHCHLNAPFFAGQLDTVVQQAQEKGVSHIVIPAVDKASFTEVRHIAHQYPVCSYALGIHPIYVPDAPESDLAVLADAVEKAMDDPRFVAVGEIGLDFYLPERKPPEAKDKQEHFLSEQLKIARRHDLPVLLHTLRSVDTVLGFLKRYGVRRGIAHAFNGSVQQALGYINQGVKISFCGTVTYDRAQQRRRLAAELPLETIVVETDSPDLPPYWKAKGENSPVELSQIAETVAQLRGILPEVLAQATSRNAIAAIPRLAPLL